MRDVCSLIFALTRPDACRADRPRQLLPTFFIGAAKENLVAVGGIAHAGQKAFNGLAGKNYEAIIRCRAS
jgi:hypothetical protein